MDDNSMQCNKRYKHLLNEVRKFWFKLSTISKLFSASRYRISSELIGPDWDCSKVPTLFHRMLH